MWFLLFVGLGFIHPVFWVIAFIVLIGYLVEQLWGWNEALEWVIDKNGWFWILFVLVCTVPFILDFMGIIEMEW